jgi:hypothetical protein
MQALPHPAMAASMRVLGSLVLDVTTGDSPSIAASFLSDAGVTRDAFTIVKQGAVETWPPPAVC